MGIDSAISLAGRLVTCVRGYEQFKTFKTIGFLWQCCWLLLIYCQKRNSSDVMMSLPLSETSQLGSFASVNFKVIQVWLIYAYDLCNKSYIVS